MGAISFCFLTGFPDFASLWPGSFTHSKYTALTRGGPEYQDFLTDAGRLLPNTVHATLLTTSEAVNNTKRIVVVGDVHGCLHELQEILQKVNYSQQTDLLLFNGDMVNKGPYSVQVIQEIRRLGGFPVRGNNDDRALAAWEAWHRGEMKLEKKLEWVKELPVKDAAWLAELPWTFRIPDLNLVMVHGGLIPEVPLSKQSLETLYTLRELIQDKHGHWRMAQDKEGEHGPEWASVYNGRDYVIFGHDSGRGLQEGPRSLGLDTGCVYGNVLTAAILDLKEVNATKGAPDIADKIKLVSVKAHHQYSPPACGSWDD